MKNHNSKGIFFLIIGILFLSLTSCARPYPKEPTDVALAFYMALIEQDYDGAKKYCTDNFIAKEFNPMQSMMKTMANMAPTPKPETDKKDRKKMKEFLDTILGGAFQSSVDGNEARIWVSGQDLKKTVLVKEGAKWKLDRTEVDESAMQEAMKNMMKQFGK